MVEKCNSGVISSRVDVRILASGESRFIQWKFTSVQELLRKGAEDFYP